MVLSSYFKKLLIYSDGVFAKDQRFHMFFCGYIFLFFTIVYGTFYYKSFRLMASSEVLENQFTIKISSRYFETLYKEDYFLVKLIP